MSELTTWLLEQIAADEAVARAATPGPWRVDHPDIIGSDDGWIVQAKNGLAERNMPHIARHDPARVLAECAAKRAIVELHSQDGLKHFCPEVGDVTPIVSVEDCPTLRALASAYAGADGWREEWS